MTRVDKRKSGGKGGVKKLKLKKETIRDLDVKSKAKEVKGGGGVSAKNTVCVNNMCRGY